MSAKHGVVYLVGAGPGDPGLITVRGAQLLTCADVIVHDRLIDTCLLAEAKPGAEIIDAGKLPGERRDAQERINTLLIDRAREGKIALRLKGGDPFVFGRGYEEVTALRQAGLECVVVPGVSSALAAPAAAGIPITDRGTVRSVAMITGRTARDSKAPPLDYSALAAIDALVILMGRANLAELAGSLMAAGRAPTTPAACIEWATTPAQRVTVATLATIAEAADRDGLEAPVVTVVGEVAAYARAGDPTGTSAPNPACACTDQCV